ncbi:MAG: YdcF family protein [Synergistaceae bacterium]|nr:YdcF family protein [Synergistaceae bacterium]NLL40851.1 YdcF family protein [Synergistaceae bacterium]
MFYAYKLLGSMIAPPGSLIIITVLFSFLLLRTKSKKMLFWAMLLFSASIWFMSTSVGSYAMIGGLERKYENSAPVSERPIAFLVLAGGSNYDSKGREVMPAAYSLERIYTAVTSADPEKDVLIFSGGNVYGFNARTEAEIMEECALKMGWKGKTVTENSSRTTEENMTCSAKIIADSGLQDIVIVTNAFHMPRSMLRARSVFKDKNIFPLSGGLETYPGFRGLPDLFPDAHNFRLSCMGIKEWIGILAFRILG